MERRKNMLHCGWELAKGGTEILYARNGGKKESIRAEGIGNEGGMGEITVMFVDEDGEITSCE